MLDENLFLKALSSINSDNYDEKTWLKNNFELFKQTLIWPENLPPINRSMMVKGSLMLKFNETYNEILSEYDYVLNNKTRALTIKQELKNTE
jgi:lipoate synthase